MMKYLQRITMESTWKRLVETNNETEKLEVVGGQVQRKERERKKDAVISFLN